MNIIKLRYIPYTVSILFIIFSAYFIFVKGLPFSTEFKGGSSILISTTSNLEEINSKITPQDFIVVEEGGGEYVLETSTALTDEELTNLENQLSGLSEYTLLTTNIVAPVIGQELILKTLIAVLISVAVIFAFVAYSFKSVFASTSAIIAMLHDTFILTGFFAFFGSFSTAKIDLLFVTALLTVLSFSLYDTIVIFDKVRENYKNTSGGYYYVLDISVKQTMVRSINNSITSMLVLFSLALFVSGPLYWFSIALLIGVILGTYSSPFVAVPVFYDLNRLYARFKDKRFFKKSKKLKK